jgi:hypothetical protein
VREPEGIETPLPGRSSEKYLVKRLRTVRSQCRGRGFGSHHLYPVGSGSFVRPSARARAADIRNLSAANQECCMQPWARERAPNPEHA